MTAENPITPLLERQGVVILDGGLAAELEARGADLDHELWSARYLQEDPDLIRRIHLDYLDAGADCVISASYQATVRGFRKQGLSDEEAVALLRRSVELACAARDDFWDRAPAGRLRPLVAASVGAYGAYLADGSEYTGRYDLDEAGLTEFHRRRFRILAASGADLLACETLPSGPEARALLRLLGESPGAWAWFSFTCRDEIHLSDGTPLAEMAAELDGARQVVAVGVNCTAPRFIPALISELRRSTRKPVVVYPNSGETYDAERKAWSDLASPPDFGQLSSVWFDRGASLVGGCCRTGPRHIRQIRSRLLGAPPAA